jgi:hypothetical protein
METLAIIINSYRNNETYLKTAIHSCLAQTGVCIKLIVSTVEGDSAIDIAKTIDENIVIIKNPLPGIYEQLNNALPLAMDADYFHYFSGNDFCLSTKAEDEIDIMNSVGKMVCYSNYRYADEKLNIGRITDLPSYNYAKHMKGNFIPDWSIMKTSVLKQFSPFQVRHGNDAYYDFWLRVAEGLGNVFAFNTRSEVLYRQSNNSKHILRRKNPSEKARYARIRTNMLKEHGKGLGILNEKK